MTASTCIGHGRNRSTLRVGTSVVDHVLRVRGDATQTLALPACTALDQATHGPVLQLLASNLCPVLFFTRHASETLNTDYVATGTVTSAVGT